MISDVAKSITSTISYSDVFDYPLTKEEMWRFLMSSELVEQETFEKTIKSSKISKKGKFYFLPGRSSLVKKRIEREKESKRKMRLAKRVVVVLCQIPTVEFIGVSGALAMSNSGKDDDIDFFIITSKKALWITRLFILLVLECMGIRRKRQQQKVSDTICVNMILTGEALRLPGIKKDLYTAHEIVQVRPVFDRNNVFEKFINANMWVEKYLPNSLAIKTPGYKDNKSLLYCCIVILLSWFEPIARTVQMTSIRKHQTTEIVTDKILAFHPYDYRAKVLSEYKKRLKKYEI